MNKSKFNCQLEIKAFGDEENYFTFEGYASTFGNIDRGNDKVMKGAFVDSIAELSRKAVEIKGTPYKKLMPILWQHQWDNPIGSFVEMREDAKGLYVKGIMPKDDSFVRDRVMPQMKIGSISDMSIGYLINKRSFDGDVQNLEKIGLLETSLVTIPMNPEANLTAFKSFGDVPIAEKETPWNEEQAKANIENHDEFSIAGQLIADKIDGKSMIVPHAIFRLAAKMVGAEGESEQKSIIEIYEKMGLKSPYQENGVFRVDDIKAHSERQLETLLKNGVCFSNTNAKALIAILKEANQRDVEDDSQRDAELKKSLEKLLETFK